MGPPALTWRGSRHRRCCGDAGKPVVPLLPPLLLGRRTVPLPPLARGSWAAAPGANAYCDLCGRDAAAMHGKSAPKDVVARPPPPSLPLLHPPLLPRPHLPPGSAAAAGAAAGRGGAARGGECGRCRGSALSPRQMPVAASPAPAAEIPASRQQRLLVGCSHLWTHPSPSHSPIWLPMLPLPPPPQPPCLQRAAAEIPARQGRSVKALASRAHWHLHQ